MTLVGGRTGLALVARPKGKPLLPRPPLAPPQAGYVKTFHADFRRAPIALRATPVDPNPQPLTAPTFRPRIGPGYDATHDITVYGSEAQLNVLARPEYAAAGVIQSLPGETVLQAMPTPAALLSAVGGQPYISAIITTQGCFAQRYGHFECRAWLPDGAGAWPAFWLLPANNVAPPELDVIEYLGSTPGGYYATTHSGPGYGASDTQQQRRIRRAVTDGFHWYGVAWDAAMVTFYFDRQPVAAVPTPADMTGPMYLICSLSIGTRADSWAGAPDPSTPFPLRLRITDIAAWAPS